MTKKIASFLLALLTMGCREIYNPTFTSPETGYLVVEGIINSGLEGTDIILSRTTKLNDNTTKYESGAQAQVEGDDNSVYYLTETSAGHYTAGNLGLNAQHKYRLHITSGAFEYVSDFEPVRYTPPIDSISYKMENGGMQLYINTHDPANSTRYYQWLYDETWEFHSQYYSALKYDTTEIPGEEDDIHVVFKNLGTYGYDYSLFTCWQYSASTSLLLGSSARLSQDAINLPLLFIPGGSIKLSVLYSVKVKQMSWTREGYEFLERMKKNTEATGSLFDAQPSELNGNIHCVNNPSEPVIGFVNISNIDEKRIFIKSSDIDWEYRSGCFAVEIENISDSIKSKGGGLMPSLATEGTPFAIDKFSASYPVCIDCTLTGNNIKPDYWP
ncbi:MAG: DUF4249 domain-containing protein [Flavitalea sp.]